MEREGGLVVRGRVEIDMRQPFRSVKEAISLFGEKVLAGEIYATNKLNLQTKQRVEHQKQEKQASISHDLGSRNGSYNDYDTNENSVKKTNEEGKNMMAFYLNTLKQELEETKKELQQLKTRDKKLDHQEPNPEIEEIKFVEKSTTTTTTKEVDDTHTEDRKQDQCFELDKKRSVRFASPPLLTRIMDEGKDDEEEEKSVVDFESPNCVEKKKRRNPLFGGFFSKKKSVHKSKSKSYKE